MTNRIDLPHAETDGRQTRCARLPAEKLLAYQRGELSAEDADRVQEALSRDPESVETFLDLAVHPYEGRPGDPDYLSADELASGWEQLQDRIRQEEGGATVLPFRPRPWLPWSIAAAAAVFAAAVGLRSFNLQGEVTSLGAKVASLSETARELRQPRGVFQRLTLLPGGPRGAGAAPPAPLAADSLLTLAVDPHPTYPDYRIDIVTGEAASAEPPGEPQWSRSGLSPATAESFELWLPRDSLPPGAYRLQLFGIGEEERLLAEYSLRF